MSTQKPQPECPECERLTQVSDESNKIGEFLDWLFGEGKVICEWVDERSEAVYDEDDDYVETEWLSAGYYPINRPIEQWLAEYYNIDLQKVEQERRVLLEWLREVQGG